MHCVNDMEDVQVDCASFDSKTIEQSADHKKQGSDTTEALWLWIPLNPEQCGNLNFFFFFLVRLKWNLKFIYLLVCNFCWFFLDTKELQPASFGFGFCSQLVTWILFWFLGIVLCFKSIPKPNFWCGSNNANAEIQFWTPQPILSACLFR